MIAKQENRSTPSESADDGRISLQRSLALNRAARALATALPFVALGYALLAGLRTVGDPDLGWQLATGRWIVQHRAIPLTDILSYTARGREWIYPFLSQALFYCLYQVGGYSLLSWLGAAACVGTIGLQIRRGGAVSQALAVIAVPLIASRTSIRAEVFTTVLFAAFVSVLWHYHRSGEGKLWVLPALMVLWVNLHLGYISGLGMCCAYVALEVEELFSSEQRRRALQRLKKAMPWIVATFVATLVNPWGARDYVGVARLVPVHSSRWVVELMSVPLTASKFSEAFAWREPKSAIWWMAAAMVVAAGSAIARRRVVPLLIFVASLYLVAHAVRFEGPFATVTVIMGGAAIADGLAALKRRDFQKALRASHWPEAAATCALVLLVGLAGVRAWGVVTSQQYYRTALQDSFGPGESWWYPEEAAAFIKRERLPGNVYNDYTTGGFMAWRLLPEYPDYIDGRGSPFGDKLFFGSLMLQQASLDSEEWQKEADERGINTAFVNLDHDVGVALYRIGELCQSKTWRPVYMDPKAAVFVRVRPENEALISRLQIDCTTQRFDGPNVSGLKAESHRFNYYLNASAVLLSLGRETEAMQNLKRAEEISSDNGYLHYMNGVLLLREGNAAAGEAELRKSLKMMPSDITTYALVSLYRTQGRNSEAIAVLRRAAEVSPQSYQLYFMIGVIQLDIQHPEDALQWFDRAERENAFVGGAQAVGRGFNAQLASERARAYRRLGKVHEAIASQRTSLRFAPENRSGWLDLAELCESAGQSADAAEAREHAAALPGKLQ